MYTTDLRNPGQPRPPSRIGCGRTSGSHRRLRGPGRGRRHHRAQGLDAGRLSPHPDPADLAARPFRDRRHAAGGQLDHPRAEPAAQGHPAGQGPGRGRPRPLSLLRRRDPGHVARGDDRGAAFGQGQVFDHLQLSDPDLGRHRGDRLAGRRGGDHEPDPPAADVLRPLRPGHGAHLQGGELSPAPGLRADHGARRRHGGAEADGAGRPRPLVVAER